MTPWTVARQAPLSMRFPKQEYWSGLPFPSPGNLPDPGIEPMSPTLAGEFFTTEFPRKPLWWVEESLKCHKEQQSEWRIQLLHFTWRKISVCPEMPLCSCLWVVSQQSCPWVSTAEWGLGFRTPMDTNITDTQVSYVKWCGYLHITYAYSPIYFQ